MQNTAILQNKTNSNMSFDVKGSTVGRKTKLQPDQQKFWYNSMNHKKILKDINYLEINKEFDGQLLKLDQE